ncbi:MAG: hypothetical protein ACTSQE_12380 [Candidatus Heimdallarchaeaceae archaeon]
MHRRGGKDCCCFNIMVKKAYERVGNYYVIFPSYTQARKSFWDCITEQGNSFIDYCPKKLIKRRLNNEMKLFLKNGSIIQVIGSDNPDALRGSNPVGVVLSEFAYQNPTIWTAILDPILEKNGGWAIFNSTPQGKNYFYTLFKHAQENPDKWFSSLVSIEDSGLIDPKSLEVKLSQGISQEMIDTEYYCSWEAGTFGSYYGKSMQKAEAEGRVGYVPYDKNHLVYTAWDIGIADSMSIVFFQKRGNEILLIDHYENSGYALQHYLDILREREYNYAVHYLPHDGKKREAATGSTFVQVARESGYEFDVIDNTLSVLEGIEKVRGIFPRIFIDKDKCDYLIKCLLEYHSEWDDKSKIFRNRPLHNWASHTCDAVRMMAISLDRLKGPGGGMSSEELKALRRKAGIY